ncbi:hypothetical protein ASD99_24525 [Mesorhizobium sp. Root695]|nr:hypothetical protein ASD99_24525 [Mesorhizobium sp. Root695]
MILARKSNESGNADTPANDNLDANMSRSLDAASNDEENLAALVTRTERRAILVLLGMGGWLMLVPAIYVVLTHGI